MKQSKAEQYAANWGYLGFCEAIFYQMPESLRFRLRRAFGNRILAESNWKGNLFIRKRSRLTPQEAIELARWINDVFVPKEE